MKSGTNMWLFFGSLSGRLKVLQTQVTSLQSVTVSTVQSMAEAHAESSGDSDFPISAAEWIPLGWQQLPLTLLASISWWLQILTHTSLCSPTGLGHFPERTSVFPRASQMIKVNSYSECFHLYSQTSLLAGSLATVCLSWGQVVPNLTSGPSSTPHSLPCQCRLTLTTKSLYK
jgi:hypothetical protein